MLASRMRHVNRSIATTSVDNRRLGNNYPLALGNAASKNAQGLRVLQSFLNNVARTETKPIPGRLSFGHYIDIYGTNGLIARFSQPGRGPLMFIGFRD